MFRSELLGCHGPLKQKYLLRIAPSTLQAVRPFCCPLDSGQNHTVQFWEDPATLHILFWYTLQVINISHKNGILKMIFLFPRWDMLVSWMVVILIYHEQQLFQISNPKTPLGILTWTSVASASWMQKASRFPGGFDVNPVFCLGKKWRDSMKHFCCMIKAAKKHRCLWIWVYQKC